MSNLPTQQNNSTYVQQFSEQNARELVEDMLFLYGKKFTDQWSGLKKSQIIAKLVEKLSCITFEQFTRGLQRLETAEWPPSIPEFKNWCLGKYEYQSHDDAWLQALSYEKNNRSHLINKFAKHAFDEVIKPYGHLGSSDTFYKVFTSVYKRLITEAKERNEADEVYEAVGQLSNTKSDENHNPVSNEFAQQQLENLKNKLNVRNRMVHKPQKLKPTIKQESLENPWPDPFDNPDKYQEMLMSARNLGGPL